MRAENLLTNSLEICTHKWWFEVNNAQTLFCCRDKREPSNCIFKDWIDSYTLLTEWQDNENLFFSFFGLIIWFMRFELNGKANSLKNDNFYDIAIGIMQVDFIKYLIVLMIWKIHRHSSTQSCEINKSNRTPLSETENLTVQLYYKMLVLLYERVLYGYTLYVHRANNVMYTHNQVIYHSIE